MATVGVKGLNIIMSSKTQLIDIVKYSHKHLL